MQDISDQTCVDALKNKYYGIPVTIDNDTRQIPESDEGHYIFTIKEIRTSIKSN